MGAQNLFCEDISAELNNWAAAEKPNLFRVPQCEETVGSEDARLRYVMAISEAFDLTKQAVSQISAVVLVASLGGRLILDHPALSAVARTLDEVEDLFTGANPPAFLRHNHDHLQNAVKTLRSSISGLEQNRADNTLLVDQALPRLHAALQEITWAASGLPGLRVVALDQACGCHQLLRRVEITHV